MGANIPSPDGQSVLYTWQDPQNLANPVHFGIVPSKGGAATYTFDRMVGGGIVIWAPDGKSIDYLVTRGGVTNIWRQALSGGPAKQLTHFTSDLVPKLHLVRRRQNPSHRSRHPHRRHRPSEISR